MDAKKCDRCSQFYIHGDAGVTNVNRLYLRKFVQTSRDKDIDLCPECKHDLDEWFDKFNKKEEQKDD